MALGQGREKNGKVEDKPWGKGKEQKKGENWDGEWPKKKKKRRVSLGYWKGHL